MSDCRFGVSPVNYPDPDPDSYSMWLMKVKESHQFQFFASYAIDIHANEFQPTNKTAFICTTR